MAPIREPHKSTLAEYYKTSEHRYFMVSVVRRWALEFREFALWMEIFGFPEMIWYQVRLRVGKVLERLLRCIPWWNEKSLFSYMSDC